MTESGAECLPWADVPTFLERTPHGRGLRGQRNFCRNPDGRSRPWCFYRNSHGRVDWGYCDCRQEICRFSQTQLDSIFTMSFPKCFDEKVMG
ncbi:UNVERIFIED_CONTAM: Neurotrypsin [Gekko kuhli]